MGAVDHLSGQQLSGRKIPGNWTVKERIKLPEEYSGNVYSVGYRVVHEDGREAFLKGADLDIATDETADFTDRIFALTTAQKFERGILEYCRGNNMDRVVVALDYGDSLVVHEEIRQPIFYIIFELAKSDARSVNLQHRTQSFFWNLHILHNIAVAIRQLHQGKVAHNDVKPANVLVFEPELQKLGDLGSATSDGQLSPCHEKVCAGDPKYAAPEVLFCTTASVSSALTFHSRRASDVYLLGSLACFFITGQMMTPAVLHYLREEHKPQLGDGRGWQGDLQGVLPYWREAFSKVLSDVKNELPQKPDGTLIDESQELLNAVSELCEPDPDLRGHPKDRAHENSRYSVVRYISIFDRLRKSVSIKKNAN